MPSSTSYSTFHFYKHLKAYLIRLLYISNQTYLTRLLYTSQSISLLPLKILKTPPLAAKLQPFESSILMKIIIFCKLGTYLISFNVRDLSSAIRNWIAHLPTTLFVVLFVIPKLVSPHMLHMWRTSLYFPHKW